MARPLKQGLDYFPLDVGFIDDIKIRRIKKDCGGESVSILLAILCSIYREEGYFIEYNADLTFLLSEQFNVDEAVIEKIIERAVEVGFFEEQLFETESILTSRGIQKRFFEAVTRRKEVIYEPDYMLIKINDYNNLVNANINSINDSQSTQSKEEESKGKERREEEERACAREESSSSSSPDSVIHFLTLYNQAFEENIELQDLSAEEIESLGSLTAPKAEKIIQNVTDTPFLLERNTISYIASHALEIYKGKYKQFKDPPKARSGTVGDYESEENQRLWDHYGVDR